MMRLCLYTFLIAAHAVYGFRVDLPRALSGASNRAHFRAFSTTKGAYMDDENKCIEAVVVGGGLSGSTAAFYLQKRGVDCRIAEALSNLGGSVITRNENGFLWEEGPNSFQPTTDILKLAKDLNMLDDIVLSDPAAPRFIYYDHKLQALPMSVSEMLQSELLTAAGKLKAFVGAMGYVSPKPLGKEETIKEFVTRHLGDEMFERVVDPFVSGIYAGDPDQLSMKAALGKLQAFEDIGWTSGLAEGVLAAALSNRGNAADEDVLKDLPKIPAGSLGTFKKGMGSILRKIQRNLGPVTTRTSHQLISLEKDGKYWISSFQTPNGEKILRSKAVLLTVPAYTAADVLSKSRNGGAGVVPEAELLNKIKYPAVASVTLAYPTNAFKRDLNGFGHLIPRSQQIRTLGTIWASSLFPGRAPDGYSSVLSFIGGSKDPGISALSSDELVKQAHEDLKKIILKDYAPEPIVLGVKRWEKAIPQYERGHADIIDIVDKSIASNAPGLYLGGNFKGGVSFGDCIKNGAQMADRIGGYLMHAK